MKSIMLVEMLKQGNFVIPMYLFQLREKFSLPLEEFLFLVYLTNIDERFMFDPVKLSKTLSLSLEDVMVYVDHLTEQGWIQVDVVKNEKGIMEEYVSLKLFYEKVSHLLIDDIAEKEENRTSEKKTIYDKVAEGFARPINSIEREVIASWVENGFSEELISAALKETVLNGVSNLRYMDRILYEWNKKGYKTEEDVEKGKKKYQEERKGEEKLDLFDYDWFDDDES